jgi:hypothetical protein
MIVRRSILLFLAIINLSGFCYADEYQFERSCPLNVYDGINTNYGEFRNRSGYTNHDGIDYQARKGLNVYPVCGGTVTTGESSGWGKYVIIDSTKAGKSFQTRYAHLSQINVKTGDAVSSEAVIGLTGNTGISTGPTGYHLHFSFGPTVNPIDTLNPIVHGLRQQFYKNDDLYYRYAKAAMIVPIDSDKRIISHNIEKCVVFFNPSSKKKVNAGGELVGSDQKCFRRDNGQDICC